MPIAVSTPHAPAAIGPYSQGVQAGLVVWVSGQLGLDPVTGALVGPDVAAQARQALTNLQHILAADGLKTADVMKTTVYLTDMADFDAVNAVYAEFFTGPVLPARSCVQVAALPKGGLVEIDAVAHR
ncbi:MAG: RidA family protein [Propionibacteriaceae bacterium]|jgi:2-iminobutanoate/2-iminopropanoate deaminase|nr:RidA family protein [Propionibacteriaceae bacterium]